MSLGGEAVIGEMSQREQDLLHEAWIWRAIQKIAYNEGFGAGRPIKVWIDNRELTPIIEVGDRLYRLPTDTEQFLDDAREVNK